MKLGQQLKIKQNQSLIMTPQLQQAIKLLQLTNIELAEFIEKAQLDNPFLKENSQSIIKKVEEEKDTSTYENMTNLIDPLKKENKIDLENTFDSHISANSKIENKNYNVYKNESYFIETTQSSGIKKTVSTNNPSKE